jgi:hypothetical protein
MQGVGCPAGLVASGLAVGDPVGVPVGGPVGVDDGPAALQAASSTTVRMMVPSAGRLNGDTSSYGLAYAGLRLPVLWHGRRRID